jgi:hypothetical protein
VDSVAGSSGGSSGDALLKSDVYKSETSIQLGSSNYISTSNCIAIGKDISATENKCIFIGAGIDNGANTPNAIVIGNYADETYGKITATINSIILGNSDSATLKIGPNTFDLSPNGMNFKQSPKIAGADIATKEYVSNMVGSGGIPIENDSFAIGSRVEVDESSSRCVAIGNNIKIPANVRNSIAIATGYNPYGSSEVYNDKIGNESILLGGGAYYNNSSLLPIVGEGSVIIGWQAQLSYSSDTAPNYNVAIGYSARAGTNSVAIGNNVSAGNNQVRIGGTDITSIQLGPLSISFSGDNLILTKGTKTYTIKPDSS